MAMSDQSLNSPAGETSGDSATQRADVITLRQRLMMMMLIGDVLLAYAGLSIGYYLKFHTALGRFGVDVSGLRTYAGYQRVILLGLAFLLFALFFYKIYNWKLLLRPRKLIPLTIKAVIVWFIAYLSTFLVLKFEPEISRMFMVYSAICVAGMLVSWKLFFTYLMKTTGAAEALAQKVIFVGWNPESADLADSIYGDESHPYQVLGWIDTSTDAENRQLAPAIYQKLGVLDDTQQVVSVSKPDILVVADLNLDRKSLGIINKICEVNYVQLKVLPSMFQIFISGLRLETISSKPLLGIGEMAIQQATSQIVKRLIDIAGGFFGLLASSPIILGCALLIRKEDKGTIFFAQERIGINHKPFKMYKLRSMKMGSEEKDHLNQSTLREDPRLLRIGKLMRAWNLDELPQFWNVLKGDMSLVGPRPERTAHVNRLAEEIDFYNNRHYVKPGITGWAQIHGLRGDTDLSERIRYDVYYIENWSLWMDFYCLLMTFFTRKNAY